MHSERPLPPHVRAVAPARAGRRHHGLQLPGRGLGVERDDRRGLRRLDALEAVASRRRSPRSPCTQHRAAGARGQRRAADLQPRGRRPPRGRRAARRRPPLPAHLGHRLDRAWAARSARSSPSASAARSSSSAATTASSSPTTPTSTWRCAPCSSPPSAPPASAARRRAACSSTRSIAAEMKRAAGRGLRARSASATRPTPATLMGPLDRRRRRSTTTSTALERRGEQGGRILYGGKVLDRPGFFVEPTLVEAMPHMPIACEETFAPILYVFEFDDARRGDRAAQRRAAGAVLGDLHARHARGRALPRRSTAATAASPTSTSAPRAPRSAAPSAARRRPAAAARPAPTPGRPTCAARPARSTTAPTLPLAQGVDASTSEPAV